MNSIVIGSGFGGIAAAIRLRAKGHKVKLIEKHSDLGGRARVFKKDGFTFDAGPTVITAPYLINELFSLFNKNPEDYIKLTPLKIWYQFVFEDQTKFNYSGDEIEMKKQIENLNQEDVKGYEDLVNFTKKIFEKGFLELADVPFDRPFFMMKQLPALLKLKSYKSVYSLVSSYVKNEKLRRMLSMHPLLVGGNPFTTTSIYGLILYLEKKWGIHYSMGGTGNIIKGFEKLMNEVGIEIIKGREVTKIISDGNKVTGIKLDDNTNIDANNVNNLLNLSDLKLREAGLSRQKITYSRDLAQKIKNESLVLENLTKLSSEDAHKKLTQVKGIGDWTADIYQLFVLGDMDAFPQADLAIQEGARRYFKLEKRPSANNLVKLAEKWKKEEMVKSIKG